MVGSNVFTQRLFKLWIPLLLYSVFLLFPFAWMLIVSIKPDQVLLDTRINPFAIISPTLENYRYLLQETEFPRWIWNTLVVTVGRHGTVALLQHPHRLRAGAVSLPGRQHARHRHLPALSRAADAALHSALADRLPTSGSTTATGR